MNDLFVDATAGIINNTDFCDDDMGVKKGDQYIKLDFYDISDDADDNEFIDNNIIVYRSGAIDATIGKNTKHAKKLLDIYKKINGGKTDDIVEFDLIESYCSHDNNGVYIGGNDKERWNRTKQFINDNRIVLLTEAERELEAEGMYDNEITAKRL